MSTSYLAYNAAKRDWLAKHPDATAIEFEAACKRLARKYGV